MGVKCSLPIIHKQWIQFRISQMGLPLRRQTHKKANINYNAFENYKRTKKMVFSWAINNMRVKHATV